MKKILLILIISISLTSYGESIMEYRLQNRNDVWYEIDKQIPYTGEALGYYENEKLQFKKNYKDGKLNGISIWYYENGQIRGKRNYIDGLEHGNFIAYYENGKLQNKGNYKDGELIN